MLVCLDLGQSSGVAIGGGASAPSFATIRIGPLRSDADIGPALVAFRRAVVPIIVDAAPTEVFIEAALPVAAVNNRAANGARMGREIDVTTQYALAGVARMICADLGIPCSNARVNTVRAYFLRGIPTHDARGEAIGAKDRVVMACVQRGWKVSNNHEADAGAILAWRMAQTAGGIAA